MGFVPLQNHTHYSLQDAIARPAKLAKRAAQLEYPALAMTDHGNLGCAIDFVKATEAEGIKPIIGCEFSLCRLDATIKNDTNERPYSHLVVLAKNLDGWKQLIRAVSASSSKEFKYYTPRIDLERLAEYGAGGNLIAMSGHPCSDLANAIFTNPREAYVCDSERKIRDNLMPPYPEIMRRLKSISAKYLDIFGKENFFLEVMLLHPQTMPAQQIIANAMRWLSGETGIPCVATTDTHYVNRDDADDHRILLCSKLHVPKRHAVGKVRSEHIGDLAGFFCSSAYHLPSPDEMAVHHTPEELEWSGRIADMCEKYNILHDPILPPFPCPDSLTPDAYLERLCEYGWKDKIENVVLDRPIQEYEDRLKMELGVIKGAGLSGYFLIVQDYMNYGRSKGWLLGPGRGSGAGCLVSYLTGITGIDPLIYDLMFERFYNAGRNKPGHISYPDIDCDFPISKRPLVYTYLQGKFGEDKVAKIATFTSMKGKSALREVFRAHEINDELQGRITKIFPDPARISEELEEMRQRGEDPSVISFVLDVYHDELAEWVIEREDGSLEGEFAAYFAQARRLEGVKKNISTHTAGVVIAAKPLAGLCPMDYDEPNDQYRAAMEYPALEAIGIPKFDVLGVAALDKGEAVRSLLLTGEIDE